MNSWTSQDPSAIQNGFADPSMLSVDSAQMFAANNAAVNGVPFANPQAQQALAHQQTPTPNSQQRSQTPQQFSYNVQPVVPSKRARPGEDGSAGSPGQPGMNMSRSQTPQQAAAFAGQFQYPHLQAGNSANATPSPTMQNQQFRQQGQAQRMQTLSPNPQFAQQQQQQNQQQQQSQPQGQSLSPPPDPSGRSTPQNAQFSMAVQMAGPMGQMPGQITPQMANQLGMGMPGQIGAGQNGVSQTGPHMNAQMAGGFPPGAMPAGFNPNFPGPGGNMQGAQPGFPGGMTPNMTPQQVDAQRQYQMRQQMAMQRRIQQAGAMPNMMPRQAGAMGTPPRPTQQNPQLNAASPNTPVRSFLNNVSEFMEKIGRPFDSNPTVSGRPVNLFMLFQLINKLRGSNNVSAMNQWGKVAATLNFMEPTAGQEIKDVFDRCLGPYESAVMQRQHQKQQAQAQGPQGQQMSPVRRVSQSIQPGSQNRAPSSEAELKQQGSLPPPGQMTPVQANQELSIPAEFEAMNNGWNTPKMDGQASARAPDSAHQNDRRAQEDSPESRRPDPNNANEDGKPQVSAGMYPKDCYEGSFFSETVREGGINVKTMAEVGKKITLLKPHVPEPQEMGIIDVRALSLSLQSGIGSEVRYALDVLFRLSSGNAINLARSEDLLDILIDLADEQLDILTAYSEEISDAIDFPIYQDVFRDAEEEKRYSLIEIPEVGSGAYNRDRAADKFSAVIVILRNFSFPQQGQDLNPQRLATEPVIQCLSKAIHLIGTRHMFLTSHFHTQDFMKDAIIILSNISQEVIFPTDEDARNILHFLLAFTPKPDPTDGDELRFTLYRPYPHRYYAFAIDSFAKLIVREDPNRDYWRSIFDELTRGDSTEPVELGPGPIQKQYRLLTRAFGLAIAALPDRNGFHLPDQKLLERREATLSQGLLAADILAGMLPTSPSAAGPALARAWLGSADCWVSSMMHLCRNIFTDPERRKVDHWCAVMNRALGTLLRLAILGLGKAAAPVKPQARFGVVGAAAESPEPVLNGDDEGGEDPEGQGHAVEAQPAVEDWRELWDGIHADILPDWRFVFGYVNMTGINISVLRNLIALARLDE